MPSSMPPTSLARAGVPMMLPLLLIVLASRWARAEECPPPAAIAGTTVSQLTIAPNYTRGALVLHFCNKDNGIGLITQRCGVNGSWTLPDRLCSDQLPFDGGSAVGLAFACLNLLFVIFVLLRSVVVGPPRSPSMHEMTATPASKGL